MAEGNDGKITTLTACNAVYILAKVIGKRQAEEKIKELIDLIGLLGVEPESVSENIAADRIDFEDSVQLAEAVRWGAEAIVTRDKNGFTGSTIPVFTPAEFVAKYVRKSGNQNQRQRKTNRRARMGAAVCFVQLTFSQPLVRS